MGPLAGSHEIQFGRGVLEDVRAEPVWPAEAHHGVVQELLGVEDRLGAVRFVCREPQSEEHVDGPWVVGRVVRLGVFEMPRG